MGTMPSRYLRFVPVLALVGALALAGCGRFGETFQRGYVLQPGALEQTRSAPRRNRC